MAGPLISRLQLAISRQAAPPVSILGNRPVNMRALIDEFTEFIDRIVPKCVGADEAPRWNTSAHVGTSPGAPETKSTAQASSLENAFTIWYAEKFRLAVWCATAAALCVGPRLTREESARERCLCCAEALAGAALAASASYMQLRAGARAQLLIEILAPALELHAFGTALLRPEIFTQMGAIAANTPDITCSAHSIVCIVPLLVAHLNILLRFLAEELQSAVESS